MAERKVTSKKETGKKVRVWFRKEDGSRTKIKGHYKPDATIQGTRLVLLGEVSMEAPRMERSACAERRFCVDDV